MELNQLRYFQVIARHSNITRAAEELYISQSSLSKTLSLLEKDIGAQLFDRVGNRMVLNNIGKAFLKRVDRILLELDDAVAEASSDDRGDIRFACTVSGLCTSYIEQFLLEHPEVRLSQFLMKPEQISSSLESGELDFGLSFQRFPSERINWTPLASEEMLILTAKDLGPEGDSAPLSWFAEFPFVTINSGFGTFDNIMAQCCQAGFSPRILFDGNEPEMAFKLVAGGKAVMPISSIVYSWMARELETPPMQYIRAVRITEPDCSRMIGLAILNDHYIAGTVKHFLDGLCSWFKNCYDSSKSMN